MGWPARRHRRCEDTLRRRCRVSRRRAASEARRADREPRRAALRGRPRRRDGSARSRTRSRSCARPRSAASARRVRSSIRASRCTSCGCTSAPKSSQRCARRREISAEAHVLAMRAGKPGVFEHELEALINYTFRRHGGAGPATRRSSAPARTRRSCITSRTAARSREGDLVLVDAGCEYNHYTADITRTWPASGKFTPSPAPRLSDRARHADRSGRRWSSRASRSTRSTSTACGG